MFYILQGSESEQEIKRFTASHSSKYSSVHVDSPYADLNDKQARNLALWVATSLSLLLDHWNCDFILTLIVPSSQPRPAESILLYVNSYCTIKSAQTRWEYVIVY